jgi:hypothetical protein
MSAPLTRTQPTRKETLMSESYSLPTEPEGVIPSLIERFNSGKVSAMMTLYEGAVLIADDGRTVTDRAEIAAELERDLSLSLPLEAKARHVFVIDLCVSNRHTMFSRDTLGTCDHREAPRSWSDGDGAGLSC